MNDTEDTIKLEEENIEDTSEDAIAPIMSDPFDPVKIQIQQKTDTLRNVIERLKRNEIDMNSDFPLSSLNVFSGLNGMGKSSLIQCLLLLRQSYDKNTLPSKGLLLNGEYVELGMGDDVLSSNSESEKIRFLVKWENELATEFLFNVEPESDLLPNASSEQIQISKSKNLFSNQFQYLSADRISPKSHYAMSDYHIKDQNSLGACPRIGILVKIEEFSENKHSHMFDIASIIF